jgi:hypothetical protein
VPTAERCREYLCVQAFRRAMEDFDANKFEKVKNEYMGLLSGYPWKNHVLDRIQRSLEHPDIT